MDRLRPFFGYFGSKWRLAKRYPRPIYQKIIEPFAGSAGYSLLHHEGREVLLTDVDESIASVWEYLIRSSPSDVEKLPDEINETLSLGARSLIGFWFAKAPTAPRRSRSPWSKKYPRSSWWGQKIRHRIAAQMPLISSWRFVKSDYREIANEEATWFIDPPYQKHGGSYVRGSREIDYVALGDWCRTRKGQVIVCEGEGADWLPFDVLSHCEKRPTGGRYRSPDSKRKLNSSESRMSPKELIWVNFNTPRIVSRHHQP